MPPPKPNAVLSAMERAKLIPSIEDSLVGILPPSEDLEKLVDAPGATVAQAAEKALEAEPFPGFRGYSPGMLPMFSIRANVGGTGNANVDIASGNVSRPTPGPGIWVVCGASNGYEVSVIGNEDDDWYPVSSGTTFRQLQGLFWRAINTPPYDLVIAFFPVKHDTEEDYKKAAAQATAFAGVASLQYPAGTGPSAQDSDYALSLIPPDPPNNPAATLFPTLVPGSGPGVSVFINSNPNNDPAGAVIVSGTEANALAAAEDLYNSGAGGGDITHPGTQLFPGGTLTRTGYVWLVNATVAIHGPYQYVSGTTS
jgi:hypothetical protein